MMEAEAHVGTDEQHVVDVGRYKQGEAKGLSFSKEELRCARYAKDGSVAFAAVAMEAEALHDYASEEGGVLLRAATQDGELAERAVRFASSDQEVRYDKAVLYRRAGCEGWWTWRGCWGRTRRTGRGPRGNL